MNGFRKRRLVFSSVFGLASIAATSALFVNCTSGDHANAPSADCGKPRGHHEHHQRRAMAASDNDLQAVVYCRGDIDCANSPDFPVCGDYDMATCVAPNSPPGAPKECIFRVSEESGC